MKKKIKKELSEADELKLYKALYFKEKMKLQNILRELNNYDYLLPDAYRSIIKDIIKSEGYKYHD